MRQVLNVLLTKSLRWCDRSTYIRMIIDSVQVLRKEITVQELQLYGYCLFKALAYLHKQVELVPLFPFFCSYSTLRVSV